MQASSGKECSTIVWNRIMAAIRNSESMRDDRFHFARRGGIRLIVLFLLLAAVAGLAAWTYLVPEPDGSPRKKRAPTSPAVRSFSGYSDQLKRTIVVPTLNSAIPDRKSVIWCSSLAM